MIHHRANWADGQALANGFAHVDQQNREAVAALLDLIDRRRAADEQQQIRVLRAGNPDLLAANDVRVAFADGHGFHLRRVGSGRRLADAERLKTQLARGDARQKRALLRKRPVPQQRPHRVHLRVARARIRAAAIHFLENDGGFADTEARSAVLFRDERRQIARGGQRLDERLRIGASGIELAPVGIGKTLQRSLTALRRSS